ncbi:MAG: N-6 DNA methylase [Candidatus Omnitrophota bacterium]|nr:N-6 DNA methylase [Candidatus Omnitrophota bacterium]
MNSNLIDKISTKLLNLKETAAVLGVSSATVTNWIRHNHISPVDPIQLLFSISDVEKLRNDLSCGIVNRLNKRANKAKANRTFVPEEYLSNLDDQDQLENIVAIVQEKKIGLSEAMFLLSLNLLVREGILSIDSMKDLNDLREEFSVNRKIYQEVLSWLNVVSPLSKDGEIGDLFLNIPIPSHNDILGLIYQSLLVEGNKSEKGSYYTPPEIVSAITREYAFKGAKFFDPCCGSGQFLLSFADMIGDPRCLFGIDIDDIAVRIARINLLLKFRDHDFEPNVFCKNTILGMNRGDLFDTIDTVFLDFDIIATNPPWGVHFTRNETALLIDRFPDIKSLESFSYFLKISMDLLKKNGVLSFVLPESILNVMTHKDIRRYIVDNASVEKIVYLDRVFKNVFTPVIRFDLRKGKIKDHQIVIQKTDSAYKISQSRIEGNKGHVFDIHSDDSDSKIIEKVFSVAHTTLKDHAEWALGIVTGDNKKHLHPNPVDGAEEIFKGSDVNKYVCGSACSYIVFNPDLFQQVAPEDKYRAPEKLIYRFISKQLVFAYDCQKRLTLNSANVVIPRIKDYPIKAIMALFNSCLYQFIFQKKFSSIKVLRSHLEQLPLPLWEESSLNKLSAMADKAIDGDLEFDKVDEFIFNQFNLSDCEIQRIRGGVHGFLKD